MSVIELPAVTAYRTALDTVLEQTSHRDLAFQTQNVINTFREVRKQDDAADTAPAHDSAVESVVRDRFINLVSSVDIHTSDAEQIWKLIDVANILSQNELSEPSLAFYLVEELLDSQTIDGCRRVFDYLESRREQMVRKNFKTTSLVILRCCNELLRRLSRAEETVFCGRVFIYLFQTFPLGDRSSVNLRGVFHTENITAYDVLAVKLEDPLRTMEIDAAGDQAALSGSHTPASVTQDTEGKAGRNTPSTRPPRSDAGKVEAPPDLDTLYPQFWSLQSLFSDPTRLFSPSSMQEFKDGIAQTLSCFRHVSKNSTPTAEPVDIKRGLKRKRDPEGYPISNADTATSEDPSATSKFNPKYLTSRELFDLEIHDMAFRRHFLVQALIMLDFLLSLSPTAKQKTVGLSNRSVLYTHTLSEEDTKWCQITRARIASYIQQSGIGSEGNLYYRMVDTVLSRDKNWARWKAENCPPISRPSLSTETYLAAQKSLQNISRQPPLVNPPGSSDFNFLSDSAPLESLKFPEQKHPIPSLEEYYKSIQGDDLDLDFAVTDQEKMEIEEKKSGKVWRALRAAKGRRFVLCEEIRNGENLGALIGKKEDSHLPEIEGDGEGNGGNDHSHSEMATDVNGNNEEDGHNANENGEDVSMQDQPNEEQLTDNGQDGVDDPEDVQIANHGDQAAATTRTDDNDGTMNVAVDDDDDEIDGPMGPSDKTELKSSEVVAIDGGALVEGDGEAEAEEGETREA